MAQGTEKEIWVILSDDHQLCSAFQIYSFDGHSVERHQTPDSALRFVYHHSSTIIQKARQVNEVRQHSDQ